MPHSDEQTPQKADFSDIYDQPDPRAYFTTLADYDYRVPQYGADVCQRLLEDAARSRAEGAPAVLDLCCSYGIVTTLLNTDLTMDDLTGHYRAAHSAGVSTADLVAAGRELRRTSRRPDPFRTLGVDVAQNAVEYAVEVGALDFGAVEDLETHDPSPRLAAQLGHVDLITTTGGIGYVTAKTFDRLLRHAPPTVSVAAFCLRTYDYSDILAVMDAHGLVTEQAAGTVRQRRFVNAEEREWALASVRSHGLDPAGREDDGYFHAQLFVSRPADQVTQTPLREVIPALA